MQKKQSFLTLFLLFTIISFSQKKKVHIVTLSPDEPLENSSFYVTKIIDNRLNKENIGVAQKGLMNRQVPAKFNGEFALHLEKTFSVLLPHSNKKDSLIVKINKLFVSERTSAFSELGTCEIEIEFLKKIDTILYTLGKYSSTIEGKGVDVTKKHSKRIIEALTDCINQFSTSNWQQKDITLTQVKTENIKFNFKPPLKKGLYYNFNNLVNNQPIDSIEYDIKRIHKSNINNHYIVKYHGTKKRVKKLFGFSDGEAIYLNGTRFTLNAKEYFIKSKMIGRYIYFEDKLASMEGIIAFGVMASSKQKGIILDTKSGVATVLIEENIESLLSLNPELLKDYKNSNRTIEDVRKLIKTLNKLE